MFDEVCYVVITANVLFTFVALCIMVAFRGPLGSICRLALNFAHRSRLNNNPTMQVEPTVTSEVAEGMPPTLGVATVEAEVKLPSGDNKPVKRKTLKFVSDLNEETQRQTEFGCRSKQTPKANLPQGHSCREHEYSGGG